MPDVLFYEELREQHPDLPDMGLNILALGEAAIIDTAQLGVKHKHTRSGVSNNDCLALALARQEFCPLLTGDNAVSSASRWLSAGSLISRTGLWTWMPHSLRPTSMT